MMIKAEWTVPCLSCYSSLDETDIETGYFLLNRQDGFMTTRGIGLSITLSNVWSKQRLALQFDISLLSKARRNATPLSLSSPVKISSKKSGGLLLLQ
jgi:hypothetical protein